MFAVTILIGIYAYVIFAIGILGLLYTPVLGIITIIFFIYILIEWRINIVYSLKNISFKNIVRHKTIVCILFIIIAQACVNLLGTFGPELGFDALWYHLTIPKIYLINHAVTFIPGGLLYYSAMPKLVEMFYIPALAFGSEINAKLIHFLFGLLSVVALYKLAKEYVPVKIAIIICAIFYVNLVVAWQSITAYIDLGRTFFEVMALWGFILWQKTRKKQWLIESAVIIGLAIATKLLAVGSIVIFTLLILAESKSRKNIHLGKTIVMYWFVSMLIVLPWLVFSFMNSGNPIYPFFTKLYPFSLSIDLLHPLTFIKDFWTIFVVGADPLSPLYLIALPLLFLTYKTFTPEQKTVLLYVLSALLLWYITPRSGGGRFLLPYLPALSLLVGIILLHVEKNKILHATLLSAIIIVSASSIGYRAVANAKFIPVLIGKETKKDFLTKYLNFSFGDFYDVDGYFSNALKPTDRVLLYGFHNLYYINFPFIHKSWAKKGDTFTYIATQNAALPNRFRYWNLVYVNNKTNVSVYTLGGQQWVY